MKNLTLILILMLVANFTQAQLQRNSIYFFKHAAAIQGNDINHVNSSFTFKMVDTRLYWQENDDEWLDLGIAKFLGEYDGKEGYAAMYQLNNVRIEYAEDKHGIAISIIYDNKRITFHNYEPVHEDVVKVHN